MQGGGVWVKELWRAEYGIYDTTPEGLPKYVQRCIIESGMTCISGRSQSIPPPLAAHPNRFKALHGHHVKNRASKLWFRNTPTVRKEGLPPMQQWQQRHHKHHEPMGQDEGEAMAEAAAARAAAKAAAAGIDTTEEGALPAKSSLARQGSECCSGSSGDAVGLLPGKGSGRLHGVITAELTRPAPPASELPPPVGEVERDKEKAQAEEQASKTAGADSVASVVVRTAVGVGGLPSGVPDPHAETEEEAAEAAALLLGPLEAKLKREASGHTNPLTGAPVALAQGIGAGGAAGTTGAAAAPLKPLPTLRRAGSEAQRRPEEEEGATMATTAGYV